MTVNSTHIVGGSVCLIDKIYQAMLVLVSLSLFLPGNLSSWAIGFLFLSWLPTRPWQRFEQLLANKTGLLFIGLYLMYAIGLIYSQDLSEGKGELVRKLSFVVFPLLIGTGPSLSEIAYRYVLRAFYLGATLLCVVAAGIAVSSYLDGEKGYSLMQLLTYRELSTPVGFDPIYMALYVVTAIFFIIEDRLLDHDIKWRGRAGIATWLTLGVLFLALIFLSSRMEILVFLSCLGILLIWLAWKTGRWTTPLIILITVPLLSVFLISINDVNKERFNEMVDLEADYTENKWGGRSVRIEKWKNAVECWSAAPLLGVGTGDLMPELIKVYEKNEFQIAIDQYFNPHNQYLQTAVTLGLLGLIVLLMLFGQMIWAGYQRGSWIQVIFALIFAMSVVTESMFQRSKGIIFFVFLAMILASYRASTSLESSTE